MTNKVQPVFILPEDTERRSGKDAQRNNIAAAKAVAQAVRTTLGPKGMDKMVVDADGEVIVTNDGVTILTEIQVEHPAAKMVVEIAKTQEEAVGDGTTTAVILAGELLNRAEHLLDQNVHPSVIAKGYRLAEAEAQRLLKGMAASVNLQQKDLLENIAITAMTGKGAETHKEHLAKLVVKAIDYVSYENSTGYSIKKEDIKIETSVGESIKKTELVKGLVLDKERIHSSMPEFVEQAKILLVDCPMEIKNTEIDAKIQITDPSQMQAFLDQEEKTILAMVNKVKEVGANVLFCQRGVDEVAQHFLAKYGIFALRRVKKSDLEKLSRATGATVVSSWKELSPTDLGSAGIVKEIKYGDEEKVFIEQCPNPRAVTILVKGGTEHVAEEVKRAITDAVGDVATALSEGFIVAGAGSAEIEIAKRLKSYSESLTGREQLAIHAYAEALEIIPRTLAENAGLDPIDVLTNMRSAHDTENTWIGINVFTGELMDAWQAGVLEPLKIKTLALSSATEVAEMILRIDDVILGSSSKS